jgi:hypothetical protein
MITAKIVVDEPLPGPPGAEPARSVSVELRSGTWSHAETFVVTGIDPDDSAAQLDAAVAAMLRKFGKSEDFTWVRDH